MSALAGIRMEIAIFLFQSQRMVKFVSWVLDCVDNGILNERTANCIQRGDRHRPLEYQRMK